MSIKIIIASVIFFLLIFAAYFIVIGYYMYPDLLARGDFQDLFAGITAFFSGLAFLGVVGAILLQKEELSLQRKELKLTREELKRTAKAQESSQKELAKQAASLKQTARLNGLSAMLQHQNSLMEAEAIGKFGSSGINSRYKEEANNIIAKIEKIIDEKEPR